jgi:hypothetical protein
MRFPALLLQARTVNLGPIRIIASIALFGVICAFFYVLRHLRKIEGEIVADDLVPKQRGPRNNMVLMVSMITLVIVSLLVFLIIKA